MHIGVDLDGTLITCEDKHCILMDVLTKALGTGFSKEKYWRYKRLGFSNIESLVCQKINLADAELLNKLWVDNVENIEWAYYDKLIDGAYQKLSYFKSNGYTLHLISARQNKLLGMQKLKQTGLDVFFNTVAFVNVFRGEEKSAVMRKKNLTVYIGDTEQDYKMAVSAGVRPILVSSGMRDMTILKKYSDNVFDSLATIKLES